MTREEIIRKIKKCLKLSASANEHEAGLALQRAQEMMAKHGVSVHDVELSEITCHQTRATATMRPPAHVAMLADVVKRAFGCECMFSSRLLWNWTCDVRFIGAGANPEIAAYAFSVLLRQMERGRKTYLGTLSRRMRPQTKAKRAAAWAKGWVSAVNCKVVALRVGEKEAKNIEAYMRDRFDLEEFKPRDISAGGMAGHQAFCAGVAAGKDVSLHAAVHERKRTMLGDVGGLQDDRGL